MSLHSVNSVTEYGGVLTAWEIDFIVLRMENFRKDDDLIFLGICGSSFSRS